MRTVLIVLICHLIHNIGYGGPVTLKSFKQVLAHEALDIKDGRLVNPGRYLTDKYLLHFALNGVDYQLITRDIYAERNHECKIYNYLEQENETLCRIFDEKTLENISGMSMAEMKGENSTIQLNKELLLTPVKFELRK